MKHKRFLSLVYIPLLVILLLSYPASPVQADGIIIPTFRPCKDYCPTRSVPQPHPIAQLAIRYHHVTVKIKDQIAVTHVDQVFFNPSESAVEGTYVFPLPQGAVVSNFILWVDGKPVEGKVLDAGQARETYEEIVRDMRDPALLEYIGRGAIQASIFPIQPNDERRVELEYTQALTAENGLVQYLYPLNTEKFSLEPLESVKVSVEVETSQPVRAIYSPSHSIDTNRISGTHFTASYEASQVTPDQDFSLYYSLGSTEAFHLFTYRDASENADPGGFFMLMLAPPPGETVQASAKDLLLVLDRSGSMDGEKFQQAQSALRFILKHLNPDDHFYISAFSSSIDTFSSEMSPASQADNALRWVDQLNAAGSTDINRALLEAASAANSERPTYLIFLTDGLPTEGIINSGEILNNFQKTTPDNLHLFAFGVGYDVDTVLLDSLTQDHQGLSTYVQPGESLDEKLSGFYARISSPILTNIQVNFGSLSTYDIYPNPLPDLFADTQTIVVGRYREGGAANIQITGLTNGEPRTFTYPAQVFMNDNRESSSTLAELPRLWATRKIGALLNQVRLKGPDPETIQQIVKLSIRYGIVTPYTSYLVTEPMPLGAENQERVAQEAYEGMAAAPTQAPSGPAAVQKAAGQGAMNNADQAASARTKKTAGCARLERAVLYSVKIMYGWIPPMTPRKWSPSRCHSFPRIILRWPKTARNWRQPWRWVNG